MRGNRTDIASELAKPILESRDDVCAVSTVTLTARLAKQYGKAEGKYTTIETRVITDGILDLYGRVSKAVTEVLRRYAASAERVLVVGLGNADMTADSLGSLTAQYTDTSNGTLLTVCPGVSGSTGIESYDVVRGLCDRISPSLVIAVDSLAAAATERVCNVIQFSGGGITPGSGVSNHRKTLSRETLNVPVISVGVPLVVYATTIIGETEQDCGDFIRGLIVTPKDVDVLVRDCAHIIADGINGAFLL